MSKQVYRFKVFGKSRYVSVSGEEIVTKVSKLQSNEQCFTETPYQDNAFWGQLCHSLSIPNNFNNRKRIHKITLHIKAEHSITKSDESDEQQYCVCKRPNTLEPYAQCDRCKDWFHPRCVGFKSIEDVALISPWLCPDCSFKRTSRPLQRTQLQFDHTDQSNQSYTEAFEEEVKEEEKQCPTEFQIQLSVDEWSKIKPTQRQGYRILEHGWTDMLSEKIGSMINCVLAFSYNKVIRSDSRKRMCPYWHGKASCKFPGCTQFNLYVLEEPAKNAECVLVKVEVSGQIDHSKGLTFRRRTSSSEKEALKVKLRECTPMHLHTKKLAAADEQKLIEGNTNEVPPLTTLQKISSESNLDNRIDTNPFLDCVKIQKAQDLNQHFSPLQHQYVQFVAISPFMTHMYSTDQLQLLRDMQKKNTLLLYLDATGTVVAKPEDSKGVLYYALCCPVTSTTGSTVVAVSEMLSSDQSTPSIQHWLTCFSRDFFKMFKQHLQPQKVETDFSWAMIHACVHTFCQNDIHMYLQRCLRVSEGQQQCSFTVVHICAAHMIKILCCKVAKVKCVKQTKDLFLYSVALLQNATSLDEIQALLTDMCAVFTEEATAHCQESLKNLQTAIQNQAVIADVETARTDKAEEVSEETTPKTVRHDSPFVKLFEGTFTDTKRKNVEKKGLSTPSNPYYCPGLIDVVRTYIATLPLWTGIMLKHLGQTRDTNSLAENWFRTTKNIVLQNKLHRRPGDFIQTMHQFITGRMRGVRVTEIRQKVMEKKELEEIDKPLSQEEQWRKKKQNRKKSKYYNPPKAQTIKKASYTSPPWSGHGMLGQRSITMTNTCTIDNLLYIMYLAMKTRPFILSEIEQMKMKDSWMNTLLEVYQHFSIGQWSQGKISWLKNLERFKGKDLWNAFGAENDYVVCRLDYINHNERLSVCDACKCPFPEFPKLCWTVAVLCKDFSDLQQSINNWVADNHSLPCRKKWRNGRVCQGRRTYTARKFVHGVPPFVIMAIDATVTCDGHPEMQPPMLPSSVLLCDERYQPVAVTYHLTSRNHFVSFHRITGSHWNFYDGIKELKQPGFGDQQATVKDFRSVFSKDCTVGHIVLVRTPTEHKPVMEGSTEITEISDDTPAESSTEEEQCDRERMTLTEGQLADKSVMEEISHAMTINEEKPEEKLEPYKELQERECLSQELGACCYQRVRNQTMHSEVKNLQWTQCNTCHGWLHTECAGIHLGTDTSFNCGCHMKLPYCLKRTRAAAEKGMLECILTDEEIQKLADDLRTGVLRSNRMYLKRHPNFNLKFKQNREALISIFNEKQTTAIIDRVDTVLGRDKANLEQLSFHLDVMTPEVTLCILRKIEGFSRYEAEKAFVSHVFFEGED